MARTEELETRVEKAVTALLTTLGAIERREFMTDTDDNKTHLLVKAEKEREELPGTGVFLLNVTVRMRNFAEAQMLLVEEFFRDAATVSAALVTAGAGEFLMPSGDGAVTLGGTTRVGDGSDKESVFSFQITAQPHEVGIEI